MAAIAAITIGNRKTEIGNREAVTYSDQNKHEEAHRSREARGRARAAADVRAWGGVRASRSQRRRAGHPADTGKPASDFVQHVGQSGPLSVVRDADAFFDAIAHEPHHAFVTWIRTDPELDRFRSDPRYGPADGPV